MGEVGLGTVGGTGGDGLAAVDTKLDRPTVERHRLAAVGTELGLLRLCSTPCKRSFRKIR